MAAFIGQNVGWALGAPAAAAAPSAPAAGMSGNPYAMDFGQIPFSGAPGAMFGALGGSPQQAMSALGPAYQSSYNAALDFNRQLGNTINTGYNNAMTQQLAGQNDINGLIDSYGNSARRDISDANVKQQGNMMQSLISRGLGNTTVLDAGSRGLNSDLQRQNLQLDDQLAGMRANYRNQFNQQNTGLAGQQLSFLERMTGQYPNAGLYGQLASQFGAAGQSAQNQGAVNDALDRARQQAGAGGGAMGAIGGGGGGARQSAFGPQMGSVYNPNVRYPDEVFGGGLGRLGRGGSGLSPEDQWQQDLFNASEYVPGYEDQPYGLGFDDSINLYSTQGDNYDGEDVYSPFMDEWGY